MLLKSHLLNFIFSQYHDNIFLSQYMLGIDPGISNILMHFQIILLLGNFFSFFYKSSLN